ncbi:MAG: signal peptidase I [Clostridiaceae bacterium]|jgi:signal peptidase I|nr:signal peptidase I [Clostridiaceae bacterium]
MRFKLKAVYDKNEYLRSKATEDIEFESLRFGEQKEPDRISEMELLEFGFTENKDMSFPPIFDTSPEEYIVENVNDSFDDEVEDVNYSFEDDSDDEDEDIDIEVVEIEEKDSFNDGSVIIKKVTKKIFSWLLTITFAFVLALIINMYVLRPSKVSGDSMVPTLVDNETVYISRLPYVFGEVKFGDIVVIDSNIKEERTFMKSVAETLKYNLLTKDLFEYEVDVFWIKRVIGVEGDVIEFKDNAIYRNGQKLKEDYIYTQDVFTYPNGVTVTVEKGYIYVMGDNRNVSRDSRHEGLIPVTHVVGKLVFH